VTALRNLLPVALVVVAWGAVLVRINLYAGAFASLAVAIVVWLAGLIVRRIVPSLSDATWFGAVTFGLGLSAALDAVATLLLLLALYNRGE